MYLSITRCAGQAARLGASAWRDCRPEAAGDGRVAVRFEDGVGEGRPALIRCQSRSTAGLWPGSGGPTLADAILDRIIHTPIACSSRGDSLRSRRRPKRRRLTRRNGLWERSHPPSGRSATPATSIGTAADFDRNGGRHQSEARPTSSESAANRQGLRRLRIENPALYPLRESPRTGLGWTAVCVPAV